jgi:hypothetical protein
MMMFKKILFCSVFVMLAFWCYPQSATTYVYLDEGIGTACPFKFSFENGTGYLEIFADDINKYLVNPAKCIPMPMEENWNYYVARGTYNSRYYRDFTTIIFDDREYLFLEDEEKKICLLLPLLEDKTSSDARGSSWLSFWGLTRELHEQGFRVLNEGPRILGASSALTEQINGKIITYNRFHGPFIMHHDTYWVEGVEGYGINESITINPRQSNKKPQIIFLNGFIAPWNLDLFYQNSRVKKIRLEYKDSERNDCEETVEFKDTPKPQWIEFSRVPITPIKITILEVYSGERYKDTVISNMIYVGTLK